MPDPVLILKASAAALALTAVVFLVFGRMGGRPGWVGAAGVGVGFFVGAWLLGARPQFPPREDQDRWLLILLPAAVVVEVAAAGLGRLPWLAWSLRLVLAAGAAPLLLYGSRYVTDNAGPGSREWTPEQTWLILGGLAAALAGVWVLLDRLTGRSAPAAVPLALALACAGSGVVIILSGYASGGQLGLALAGAVVASFFLPGDADLRGVVGVGVVGLFALLVVGRFFGNLTTTNAALLFGCPLVLWSSALPFLTPVRPWGRAFAGLSLVGLPVALALVLAWKQFNADSARPSSPPGVAEPSLQDYLNFRK
jgi:hypothetical protein